MSLIFAETSLKRQYFAGPGRLDCTLPNKGDIFKEIEVLIERKWSV